MDDLMLMCMGDCLTDLLKYHQAAMQVRILRLQPGMQIRALDPLHDDEGAGGFIKPGIDQAGHGRVVQTRQKAALSAQVFTQTRAMQVQQLDGDGHLEGAVCPLGPVHGPHAALAGGSDDYPGAQSVTRRQLLGGFGSGELDCIGRQVTEGFIEKADGARIVHQFAQPGRQSRPARMAILQESRLAL